MTAAASLLLLAGCGDADDADGAADPDPAAPTEDEAEGSAPDAADREVEADAEACELLGVEELEEVTGRPFEAGEPDPMLESEPGTSCVWQDQDETGFVSLAIAAEGDTGEDPAAGYAEVRDLAEEAGAVDDVDGVGVDAYRVGGSVTALLDDALVVVSVAGLEDEEQLAVELTERVVAAR